MSDPIEPSLDAVLRSIPDPRQGLPDSVFEFVLKVTTMVNVDLLIEEPARGTLLTWREDDFGTGWHIPGGIIRFYEPIEHRIGEVARLELGASVEPDAFPYDIQQFFARRGHFISLLYRCRLTSPFADRSMLHRGGVPRYGAIGWFTDPPDKIYPGHEVYSRHVGSRPAVPPREG
jgi:hypothetical protein